MTYMRKLLILTLLVIVPGLVMAQEEKPQKQRKVRTESRLEFQDTLTDAFLDTVVVKKKLKLNDYSLIGFQYGAALSQVVWNPSQNQKMLFIPVNFGVTYTLYGKMFGYMPYFGFQAGIFYAREGYQFEYNEERDYTYTIEGDFVLFEDGRKTRVKLQKATSNL